MTAAPLMTAEQVVTLATIGERVLQEATDSLARAVPLVAEKPPAPAKPFPNRIPFNEEKARAWNSRWEQRFAPHYVTRPDDSRHFPRPPKPQPPVGRSPGGEPHSASVIRDLERHINQGRVLSPGGEP